MKHNYLMRGLGLLVAALPLAFATSAQAQTQKTVAHWSFNYGYTIKDGVGTPNTTKITSNGNVNFDGVKLGANEQFLNGDYYLMPLRHTRTGQVGSQDDKGAYHEVNAINCDGAALHMTSPVPTPETASNTWYWGDAANTFPDGNAYSYQDPYNYFEIEADTKSYKDIQLQVKAAGHNSQSQYYAVAYSTDKTTWTVVGDEYLTGTSYNNWKNTTIDLPALSGLDKAYIRIFPAKNWKGAGNNVAQDNQFDLDDVYLYGTLTAAEAGISGITIEGQTVNAGERHDFECVLPSSYTAANTTFKVLSANGKVRIAAEEESSGDEVEFTDNGDGSYTIETPRGNNAHIMTLYLTPDDGAIATKTRYTFRLFKTGEQTLRALAIDGVAVPTAVRTAINTGDAFTATFSGNIYTVMPDVTATVIDGSTPVITSELKDGVAVYTIKATERTFTLNVEGIHLYTAGEKDEEVTLVYTSAGKQGDGTWSNGLYTLECNSLDGWNNAQFKFNATDHKLSVPAGVVVKQFQFLKFAGNYGGGEGITRFVSEGATCYVPTKHDFQRGVQATVTVVLENHQPGAPIEFTITGGNQPYAQFALMIEKTDPHSAPILLSKKATVDHNHAMVALEFDREMATTEATIAGKTVKAIGGTTALNFAVYDLDYNKTYTLTLPAGTAKDLFGNALQEEINFDVEIGSQPVATKKIYDYVVGTTEEFTAAIKELGNSTAAGLERVTIFVKNGDYDFGLNNEQKINRGYVSLIGESRDGVTIRGVRNGISNPILNIRDREGFYLQDMTLQNDFNFRQADKNSGQAVAVYGGNKTIMKNIRMHGNQDTQVTGERSYFDKCEIHGTVDFICGGGDNFYDQCDLVIENRGGNVIAAPNTTTSTKWGYVFSSCTIKADSTEVLNGAKSTYDAADGTFHLGRPWQNEPRITYLNTVMHIKPADNGWTSMGTLPTHFYEYGSVDKDGNLIDLSVRGNSPTSTNTYVPILTQEQAEQYTIGNVLSGTDGWLPTDYTVLTKVPQVTVNGKTLSWEADDQVRCYVIFKDGKYLDNITETTYTVAEDGVYTIRTANDMGGLSTEAASVSVGETSIDALEAAGLTKTTATYNLAGQKVTDSYKGIVIRNGKKMMSK